MSDDNAYNDEDDIGGPKNHNMRRHKLDLQPLALLREVYVRSS
jgi:hypothetical protein